MVCGKDQRSAGQPRVLLEAVTKPGQARQKKTPPLLKAASHAKEQIMPGRRTHRRGEEGPNAAGQSADIQQLPSSPDVNSESVEELAEEGNAFEADAVAGVESAKDPDVAEVKTREVPEDDVPEEYLDQENIA